MWFVKRSPIAGDLIDVIIDGGDQVISRLAALLLENQIEQSRVQLFQVGLTAAARASSSNLLACSG